MTDKMREEFEAWHKREVAAFVTSGEIAAARHMTDFKESFLAVWEASRVTLVIELPVDIKTMAGPVMYADDVRASCKAAGLKVKP